MRRAFILAAAVLASIVPPVGTAAGQGGHPKCPGMTLEAGMKKFWSGGMPMRPGMLDTLNTWSEGADWKANSDCDKVRNATREATLFTNKAQSQARRNWPVWLNVLFGVPKTNVWGE